MSNTPIDLTTLREQIISDARADYWGLYEIVWFLNTKYPEVSRDSKVAAARTVLLDLLRDGHIKLFRTIWASQLYQPVPLDEALRVVMNTSAWNDPTNAPHFCCAAA